MSQEPDIPESPVTPDETPEQTSQEAIDAKLNDQINQSDLEEPFIETATLESEALSILKENDRGSFTVAAPRLYPHQWLWDSCFIAIGLRHHDIDRAQAEITSLLRGQWSNGMLPHIIFTDSLNFRPDQNAWQSWISPYAPDDIKTSGITQPPMLAEAVMQIGQKLKAAERRTWYKTVWPHLIAYHEWLYRERDPHNEGLVLQIHPWETGLDNTPPWMNELHEHLLPWWIRALRTTKLVNIMGLIRRDVRFVPASQRFTHVDALALFDAQRRLKREAYDSHKILDRSLFAIEDLTFNCILIRANEHLRAIAKYIKQPIPEALDQSMKLAPEQLEKLWDPYAEEYFTRDFANHELLKISTIAAFMPLYAGCISQEKADKIVKKMENDHAFGPSYPIPSVNISSEWFDPNRYWQGPAWVNTNWLIIDGLERYGFKDHAAALKETTLEMIARAGFYEYFNPLTGEPLGTADFSWTAALTIDLLHRK